MPRPAGIPVQLARVRTRDGVWLDGLVVAPRRRRSTALVWVHGLGSVFSSGQPLVAELAACLPAAGIGYVKFNTRGHDFVARGGRRLAGAAFERFTDCVEDLRAVIGYAARLGYRRIVLAGHSTGANKSLYYAGTRRDRRVRALALLGPVSDIAGEAKRVGGATLGRRVVAAERLARRDPLALVPRAWGFWSARRYVSLYKPGQAEDVFPYHRPGARWRALRAVRVPVAVVIGARDRYLDRSPPALIEVFRTEARRARSFASFIVPGANHGFDGRERALARWLVRWIRAVDAKEDRWGR
jgi:pimeloyl-ACP methyl ester carboxylesterase